VRALLLLLLAAASAPAGARAQAPADLTALRNAHSWPERLARDARLSFSAGSAREAREALAGTRTYLPSDVLFAHAYLALGSGGDIRDRPALLKAAVEGTSVERQAALFALGELRPASIEFLAQRGEAEEPEVAAAAAVALARAGGDAARAVLDRWSEGEGPRAEAARGGLAFAAGVASASPGPALETFLDLRFGAARTFGFVGGTRWKILLENELALQDAFLDRVIIGTSVNLREGPRRDHLLELLLAGGSPDRLRGIVEGMPEALAQLVEAGLWRPAGPEEWDALLGQITRRGVRPEDLPLLQLASSQPDLRARAGLLLVSANVKDAFGMVSGELFSDDPQRRLAVAQALGGLDDPQRLPDLARLRRDPDGKVRAAALVSLVRRRDQSSVDDLRDLLESGESAGRSNALSMLAAASADPLAQSMIEEALLLKDLKEDERVLCNVALSLQGRLQPRGALREMLKSPGLSLPLQELLVRALGRNPDFDDLAVLRAIFPVEDAYELNVALAQALVVNRDSGALNLLRQATWRGPWNRSCLAAGLLARHGGIQALHDELASPPERSTAEDLRRVGFALGEWGGLSEVDVLARRRRAGDPALQGAFLGALSTRTQ
jgi:HEAT repeat protein